MIDKANMETTEPDQSPNVTGDQHTRTDHLDTGLRRHSVRAGATVIATQFLKQFVIGIATTAVLARLLNPADFGLLAAVATVTNFLHRFKDLGLSMAIVQRKEITQDQVSTLFWVNTATGLLATLATAGLAPFIAWFYGEPQLTRITLILAVSFCFSGLTVQHQALMRRQMRFGSLAGIQLTSSAVGAIVGIVSALYGAGYWALVVMQLSSTVVNTFGVWILCRWRPRRPVRGSGVRTLLAFGGNLTGANLTNYVTRNLDNVLIGWRWGADALGLYAKAYQLLMLPIRQINAPLTSVAIPTLSRLQDDPTRYRMFYRKGIELLTTLGMPLVIFTIVDADKLILLILGEKWSGAVNIFRYLGPAAFLGTFNVAASWTYVSLGRTGRQLRWTVFSAIITSIGLFVGVRWGPLGVAAAFSICQLCLRFPGLLYCYRGTFLSVRDLGHAIWRPAITAAIAGAFLWAVSDQIVLNLSLWLRLSFDLLIFAVGYIVSWLIVPNGLTILRSTMELLKDLRPLDHDEDSVDV